MGVGAEMLSRQAVSDEPINKSMKKASAFFEASPVAVTTHVRAKCDRRVTLSHFQAYDTLVHRVEPLFSSNKRSTTQHNTASPYAQTPTSSHVPWGGGGGDNQEPV